MTGATVLVAGLGDLGARSLELLAGDAHVQRLVGCGSASARSEAVVGQAALVADAVGGAAEVDHVAVDLADTAAVTRLIDAVAPDVVLFAASRHSWWRTPPVARSMPYGTWLPLQLSLLRTFMRARRDAVGSPVVVTLPHPDAAGPVLAAEGLAPDCGAGNVAEVAAKLRLLAAREHGCAREHVDVRLVLHHAAERLAFAVFDLGSTGTRPPYDARVSVHGTPLPAADVDRLLRRPFLLPGGTGSHQLTAATAARLVAALLDDRPQRLHVPSPGGLPGGYPVVVSRAGIVLDLPDDLDLASAVATNERAAAFDGIAAIDSDGTIHHTDEAVTAARDALGLTLRDVPLADLDDAAEELAAVLRRLQG